MDGEDGGGFKLKKSLAEKGAAAGGGGEVDYRTKSGTAWSHNFLNQKPWHPLSYPNQRRKWIAEQTHAEKHRRTEEVAREYAQEQEFFRQTALISKKEKEKLEMMKAVSFMYVKPPGYNAESAKAAEVADEKKTVEQEGDIHGSQEPSASMETETAPSVPEKKKPRLKDIYGRALPTEEQFDVLKNAPRLDTGVAARAKPFGVEIRNVKCLRCGKYGHQSGDRECPLKDAIMPNEENRLKRDDPLTAIQAQAESSEPLKWELKQKPGMSPPRGGFNPDDPNQQIVAEDIFDEYGGFLGEAIIPELLTKFSSSKPKKKSKKKHGKKSLPSSSEISDHDSGSSVSDDHRRRSKKKSKRKKQKHSESSSSDSSEDRRHLRKKSNRRTHNRSNYFDDSDTDERRWKPDSISDELRRKPDSVFDERRRKRDPVSDEHRRKHDSVSDERGRKHNSVSDERGRKHDSASDEFGRKHDLVSDDRRRKHDSVSDEHGRKHDSVSDERGRKHDSVSDDRRRKHDSVSDERGRKRHSVSDERGRKHDSVSDDRRRKHNSISDEHRTEQSRRNHSHHCRHHSNSPSE